jgi:hypothetical protein
MRAAKPGPPIDLKRCQDLFSGIKHPPDQGFPFKYDVYCPFVNEPFDFCLDTQEKTELLIGKFVDAFNSSHQHKGLVTCPVSCRAGNDNVKHYQHMRDLGYLAYGTCIANGKVYYRWRLADANTLEKIRYMYEYRKKCQEECERIYGHNSFWDAVYSFEEEMIHFTVNKSEDSKRILDIANKVPCDYKYKVIVLGASGSQ